MGAGGATPRACGHVARGHGRHRGHGDGHGPGLAGACGDLGSSPAPVRAAGRHGRAAVRRAHQPAGPALVLRGRQYGVGALGPVRAAVEPAPAGPGAGRGRRHRLHAADALAASAGRCHGAADGAQCQGLAGHWLDAALYARGRTDDGPGPGGHGAAPRHGPALPPPCRHGAQGRARRCGPSPCLAPGPVPCRSGGAAAALRPGKQPGSRRPGRAAGRRRGNRHRAPAGRRALRPADDARSRGLLPGRRRTRRGCTLSHAPGQEPAGAGRQWRPGRHGLPCRAVRLAVDEPCAPGRICGKTFFTELAGPAPARQDPGRAPPVGAAPAGSCA